MQVLPNVLHAAAYVISSSSSSNTQLWTAPVAAAIDQLEGQHLSQVASSVTEALSIIDNSAAAQSLMDKAAADQIPDYTIVSSLCTDMAKQQCRSIPM